MTPKHTLSKTIPLNFIGSFMEVDGTWTKVFYRNKTIFKLKKKLKNKSYEFSPILLNT